MDNDDGSCPLSVMDEVTIVPMVRLRNGADVLKSVVTATMVALEALARDRLGLFGTFVIVVCNEDTNGENRKLLSNWTSGLEELKSRGLMRADLTVDDDVRSVIQSAVEFHRKKGIVEDINMRNPLSEGL